ncbi:MAG: hypothetical protein NC094_13795 [Bacteroidales bacterium]|nr:hypothetical protein [Lachnoclostridium sp.]MCM1384018.1 hypothetical protein [Lachnoclostridium sp.]MCM1466474.1 hypothetical protein [Bacteroidales bacterium]
MILYKKYCIFGLIGCLCFGIGDWLLGYVDPALVEGADLYFIRAGHGVGYNTLRVDITLMLAVLGIFFLYPGFVHIADIVKGGKMKRFLEYAFGLCSTGWMMLHLLVSFIVLVFSEAEKNGGHELAVALAGRLGSAGVAVEKCTSLFAVGAGIVLIVAILRGNTYLKKSAIVFSPIVPMLIVIVIAYVLPQSAFSYGLYTFNMNSAMMVWFVYLLAVGRKAAETV